MKKLQLEGQRFGRLVVLERSGTKWKCKCDCGGASLCTTTNLTCGNSTSCGCNKGKHLKKHGRYLHPCYCSWRSMIQRCENENSSDYPKYGGKGISVCERWKDIENFIIDMGNPPSKLHTIDRINNKLGYNKENCRWATRMEQSVNRSNSIYIEGIPIKQWAKSHNISYGVVLSRYSNGWNTEKIINTPVIKKYKKGQLCSIYGCDNDVKTRGMCNKHYLQWWKSQ